MSWPILSILALFTFVIYDVSSRFFATRSESPRAFATIYNGVITILSPLVFLVDPTLPRHLSGQAIGMTIIGLVLWGLNGRFEYFAKKNTEISTFSIITKIAPILTFILAVTFLKESLTLSKVSGIILIIIANGLLFVGHKWSHVISAKGLKYSLLISGIVSLAWLFDAININNWGVGTFSVLSFAVGTFISGLFPVIKLKELKREIQLTPIWQFAILGSFNLIAYALQLKALSLGPASNVMPIVTSTSPFVVLLGLLFLGEKDYLWRKLFAAILTVCAVYLMR